MIEDKYKVEVKYQSDFQILLTRIKKIIFKGIKPIIGVIVFLLTLYIGFYIILFLLVFFLLLFIYNKIKGTP